MFPWLSATPNLGLETGLSPRWTLDLTASANPFTFTDNKKWKHWAVRAESRYWLCERFYGHFLGLHMGGAEYNLSNVKIPFVKDSKKYRYEGWAGVIGVSYGHSWILGKRWNIETTLGLGWLHTRYTKFNCAKCGNKLDTETKNRMVPTRIGINLIYMLK